MKKFIVLGFLVFGFVAANAQEREKGTVEITPQIGFSISDYYGKDAPNGKNTAISSLNIGIGADYYFNSSWSLRSGVLFQTMGSDIADEMQQLTYLTIPVNANWHFGAKRKWNLNFGPSVGFLTNAKHGDVDVKDAFNSTQVGLNVGIGYKFEITSKFSLLVDYQHMTGLTNASKDFTVKNNIGSLNVGAVIKL